MVLPSRNRPGLNVLDQAMPDGTVQHREDTASS